MSLAIWTKWLAWLAGETTVLIAAAALLHLWLRSPRAGRTIWRASLTVVALVWVAELCGLRERIPWPVLKQHDVVITATVEPVQPRQKTEPAKVAPSSPPKLQPQESARTPLPLWIWLGGSILLLSRFCLAGFWLMRRRSTATPCRC